MENEIRSLRDVAAIWTSDVDFWIDRMSVFQEVLNKLIAEDLTTKELKQVNRLQNIILHYSNELLIDLKSRLFHHRENLRQIEANRDKIGVEMHEAHQSFEEEIEAMEKTIKDYVEEFEQFHEQSKDKSFTGLALERVLIPTDFSSNAKRATDYALSIFGAVAKEIILLNVFHSPFKSNGERSVIDSDIRPDEEGKLDNEIERLAKSFPHLSDRIRASFEIGVLIDKIQEAVQREQVDLIIMSTKGSSGLSKLLFGSATSQVIRRVNVPILVVPKESPMLPPTRLMLATDLELEQKPVRFDLFEALSKQYDSRIDILHVESIKTPVPSVHDKNREKNVLDLLGLKNAHVRHVASENVKRAINEQVKERSVDLLCVIHHQSGWLHHALGKSTSTQMVIDSHIPLLILHSR